MGGIRFWLSVKHSGQNLEEMFGLPVLPNSIMAGLLAAVGGAKFLSIITAIIASPITFMNPTGGAGMVVGLVEAWLRKPHRGRCRAVESRHAYARWRVQEPI